jgi:hypothetical protein
MCCECVEILELPAEVIEMLAHYRRLQRERGWDWGAERLPALFRWARFSLLGPVIERAGPDGDFAGAVRSVVGTDVPAGIVMVRIDAGGGVSVDTGPARPAIARRTVPVDVVVDSAADRDLVVVVAGRRVHVAGGGAAIETIDIDGSDPTLRVTCGAQTAVVDRAVARVDGAELRLVAPTCVRWSVVDANGGAWFPDNVPRKWDVHHRPFFHGREVTVPVPATELRVVCARGLEFDRVERVVCPDPGQRLVVEVDPPRLFDPAGAGWYGGDLHIHLNYSGDLVCTPQDAARMQHGEGLHLANLVAGNVSSARVYDRELLEQFPDVDLPWSGADMVARMGVEYRDDLLGHVHALGLRGTPSRYHAGHEHSDQPDDWPPNEAACRELRSLGATVGYAHPSFAAFPDDWSTERFFAAPRSAEARELIADAALGVVDSIDLISPFDNDGAVFLYHRLLSCGLRLAATAGTDVFLSFSHGPGVASNPPGWGRVYADLNGAALTVAAFQDAIRAGRTLVTNGPWLTFDVDGHGPGTVLDRGAGSRIEVRAQAHGAGAEDVTIVGPDGVLARCPAAEPLRCTVTVDGPLWIAAAVRGPGNDRVLDKSVFAHTSPVYIDVTGRRVARAADARWCLGYLDTLQEYVERHGSFAPDTRTARLGDFLDVLDRARAYYRQVLVTFAG